MTRHFEPYYLPERKPRIGFLGAGWIGCLRLGALLQSGQADVQAIADPSRESRERAQQLAPNASVIENAEELIRLGLDGIVVASPSALHAQHAIAALSRRTAVFCEKPLGRTLAETRIVVETARSMDSLLAIDFAYRFTTGMADLRALVRTGALGKIYATDLTFHNSYGPDKAWFYDPRLSGGGCVIDLGIHLIDAALWTLDFPAVTAVKSYLYSQGTLLRNPMWNAIEDYATATAELQSETVLRLACSWRLPIGEDALIQVILHGTKGSAEFRNVGGSFFDFRADLYQGRDRRELCSPPDEWSGRAVIDWARRLSVNPRFDSEVETVLKVADVIDSIYGRESEDDIGRLASS
jgi:predicted dehydrogenase